MMYKFTNGIVIYDEKTKDEMLKAGYKLVEDETKEVKKQLRGEDSISELTVEVEDENTSNDGVVERQPKECKKASK